jgi:Spy/CpxP family protein refolding chaperone
MVDMMVRGLELSDAQKAKLEEIKKEQGPKMREAYEKMSSILTEDQKKAREEAMKAAREAGKSREESREAIDKAVKLTDEQKKKQDEMRKSMEESQKSLREKVLAVLTPAQQETVKKRMAEMQERRPEGRRPEGRQ